jgi:hypothetical protein
VITSNCFVDPCNTISVMPAPAESSDTAEGVHTAGEACRRVHAAHPTSVHAAEAANTSGTAAEQAHAARAKEAARHTGAPQARVERPVERLIFMETFAFGAWQE